MSNLGSATAPMAELWGVIHGMELAWDRGIRCLHVDVDSQLALSLIDKGVDSMHPLFRLVLRCQGLIAKDWTICFSHIFREGNRAADALANFAFSLDIGLHIMDVSPPCA